MRRIARTLLLALAGLGALAPAAHAGDWTVGEITGPPGTTRIEPTAVNNAGVVVGHARFPGKTIETAFRWEDGEMIELAVPPGMPYTRAMDINDDGAIVGYAGAEQPCCTLQYSVNGARWSASKTTSSVSLTPYNMYGHPFTTTDPTHRTHGSSLFGINSAGTVVGGATGSWISPFSNPNQNLSYTSFPAVGTFSRLALPDTMNAETGGAVYGGRAYKINDDGDIMGVAGPGASRVWHGGGGTGTPYDVHPGRQGFNDEAHIAGMTGILSGTGTEQDHRALLWDGDSYEQIGANQRQSIANAINDSDWAVGRAGVFYPVQPRTTGNAYLWRPDEIATPLFTLAPTGWSMANATDINDDGMIVGAGKHGSVEMGYWMAPASIAHKLGGTVYGPGGAPVAGAQVRITNASGNVLASPVTGADGTYAATINRGGPYDIAVAPDGAYRPDAMSGCTIVGAICRLNLGRNRTVDFYATEIVVPPIPGPGGGGGGGGGPAPSGGDAPSAGRGPGGPVTPLGPAFAIPAKNKTLTTSASGVVGFTLGPFSTPAAGTIVLETAGTAKAAAKAKVVALGRASFRAPAGRALTVKVRLGKPGRAHVRKRRRVKAVAIVTARTAAGGVTTKRYPLTIRAPRRR